MIWHGLGTRVSESLHFFKQLLSNSSIQPDRRLPTAAFFAEITPCGPEITSDTLKTPLPLPFLSPDLSESASTNR